MNKTEPSTSVGKLWREDKLALVAWAVFVSIPSSVVLFLLHLWAVNHLASLLIVSAVVVIISSLVASIIYLGAKYNWGTE